MDIKKALAIGGSDPSGGAGIQADMKTLIELGIYPYTAITAVTVQNSKGVNSYELMSSKIVRDQVESVISEGGVNGFKTGMLGSAENILEIARLIIGGTAEFSVIDPVIRATDGKVLTSEASIAVFKRRLLPHAFMVTPNLDEAKLLSGVEISTERDLLEAAKVIKETGVQWVLVKGGHLHSDTAVDLLYDGENAYYFEAKKITDENVRGTGCMMASAVCGYLIKGHKPYEAVDRAKAFVLRKIENSAVLGGGSRQALPSTMEGGSKEWWDDGAGIDQVELGRK